jgi:hypothetical protein
MIRVNHSRFKYDGHLHATFDEFVSRDHNGRAHFEGQHPTQGRHRERVWPALSRYKNQRRVKKEHWHPHRLARQNHLLKAASRRTVLRKWFAIHPLEARTLLIADLAQRPPRYTDFRAEGIIAMRLRFDYGIENLQTTV